MKTAMRFLGMSLLVVLAAGALAALALLLAAAWWPGLAGGTITVDSTTIALDGVWQHGAGAVIVAWLAVWLALVVAFFAVVFAFALAAAVLALVAALFASPLLLLVFVIWLLVRAGRPAAPQPGA
jgi:hypothetical protein